MMKSKENVIKMPEPGTGGENQFNLEGILSELGSFGKYHLLLLFLLSFRDSFLAMCNFNYIFVASEVGYRCAVPECDAVDPTFSAPWTKYVLPNDTKTCYRMMRKEDLQFNTTEDNQHWLLNDENVSNQTCLKENYDVNRTVRCDKVYYEDYNSVIAEFDLGCQSWKGPLIGTIHNLGLVFSFVLSGFISDRYGRKVIIVATPLMVGIAGLIKSFSVNYWMLLVFEFLETALGYGNASMVLSLETVTQKRRVIFSCASDMLTSFGSAFFGLIAWKIPYWRHMIRAIYAPLLVVVFYIFLVDEGVRWLLAHNKKDEAVRVLNKVAKINKVTLSSKAKEMLHKITEEKDKSDQINQSKQQKSSNILTDLRSKKILLRVTLLSAIFACSMFVFNGAFVNSTGITGNKYLNFSALLLVAIPTRIITALTLTRYGRKAPICVAYLLCSFFYITSAFVPKFSAMEWASLPLYLAGKMCSSYGLFSIHVVAMEVFPTTSRNSLTNIAICIGRLGSVIAPQISMLVQFMSGLPSVVIGLVALGPAFMALLLPDTSKSALPDNVNAAENLERLAVEDESEESQVNTNVKNVQEKQLR